MSVTCVHINTSRLLKAVASASFSFHFRLLQSNTGEGGYRRNKNT